MGRNKEKHFVLETQNFSYPNQGCAAISLAQMYIYILQLLIVHLFVIYLDLSNLWFEYVYLSLFSSQPTGDGDVIKR